MGCKLCGNNNEEELAIRSSFVNGEVKHDLICLKCLSPLLFPETEENGKLLPESKEAIFEEREPSELHDRAH